MIENVGTNSGDPTSVVRITNSGEIVDAEEITSPLVGRGLCPTDICLADESFDARQGAGTSRTNSLHTHALQIASE